MKKQIITRTINRYEIRDGYYVEVLTKNETKEFWICSDEYGKKEYMFGLACDVDETEIIEASVDDYINIFFRLREYSLRA